MVAIIVGGIVAALRPPGRHVQSMIQHFAAGVVFAAVASEVLPEATAEHEPLALGAGFTIGVVAMLVLRKVTEPGGAADAEEAEGPTRLIATVGVDVIIDGLLIGVAFAAAAETGILITIALTIEVLFLGLAVAVAILGGGGSARRVIVINSILALLLGIGATIGVLFLGGLEGAAFIVVVSFAMAALLYLVTEELLVEAHELMETPVATAMFFVGFLLLLMIETLA